MIQSNEQTNGNKTTNEVAGGLGGLIVGNYLGKHLGLSGVGGLAGAAGGYLLAHNYQQNFTIPQGTVMTVRLTQPVTRRQSR